MRDFTTRGRRTLELECTNLVREILKPTLEIVVTLDAGQRLFVCVKQRVREIDR